MVHIEGLDKLLHTHPFFDGMSEAMLETLAGCAANEVYQAGDMIFREGGDADKFYVLRQGTVAVEVAAPPRGKVQLQTLHEDDVLGWSWLVPPYRWTFDARAVTQSRLISLDAVCLRGKLDGDHELAYHLLRRFVGVMAERLHASRLQMMDVYAGPGPGREEL
jgi:CRP-like cAMP-binding protein